MTSWDAEKRTLTCGGLAVKLNKDREVESALLAGHNDVRKVQELLSTSEYTMFLEKIGEVIAWHRKRLVNEAKEDALNGLPAAQQSDAYDKVEYAVNKRIPVIGHNGK
jgi:hypothetical protein